MELLLEPEIREQSSTLGVVRPWVENPYALVSWWEMERFAAAAFHDIGTNIGMLTSKLESLPRDMDAVELATAYSPLLEVVRQCCSKIGLKMSPLCIDDFFAKMRHGMTADQMRQNLAELNNSIRWEMQTCFFFYMPWEQVKFYDQKELFGAEVIARFPSIQFDMVEAGNCCAMGRGTACVFHLMRVMEIGVQEFGKKLDVQLAVGDTPWQKILDQVNKAIKALPQKATGAVEMGQAAANLYAVKLVWRNEVMHPNDKYTLEEAKDLIGQVKLFMGQLASII
jgi:hypothetical protein